MYRAEATDGRRAVVVQGMVPPEEPPWPAFKDLPDDAFGAEGQRHGESCDDRGRGLAHPRQDMNCK